MSLKAYIRNRSLTVVEKIPSKWPKGANYLLDPESRNPIKRKFTHALLSHVQGNVLQGHGRNAGVIIPFRVKIAGARGPEFWREVEQKITWAEEQRGVTDLRRLAPQAYAEKQAESALLAQVKYGDLDGSLFCGFSLSAAGMKALGVADDAPRDQAMLFDDKLSDIPYPFNHGMKPRFAANAVINREIADWKEPYQSGIDGIWLLAGNARDPLAVNPQEHLAGPIKEICEWCERWGLTPWVEPQPEFLTTWRDECRNPREPFGFVDGVSMPTFFVPRPERDKLGGRWVKMPLAQALISPAVSKRHAGGSFLVLRKLEQNVAAFRAQEAELRKAGLGVELLVGRERDGRPLAPLRRAPHDWARFNIFDFKRDRKGRRCPFHAHIRKVNPREDARGEKPDDIVASAQEIVRAQLVRRGMVYDPQGQLLAGEKDPAKWPVQGTGLMFMAYMSDIVRQFEQLQMNWMHDENFPRINSGTDALLASDISPHPRRWPGGRCPVLSQFVFPQGGEYLYTPPRHWLLRQLSPP